jgi:hypothetical protein
LLVKKTGKMKANNKGSETKCMTIRATRKTWSAKKKAKVLTVGSMIFLTVVIILLPHAFALR